MLNYANAQGVRWVVLCNGRQWWLYDQSIFGTVADKFVIGAELFDTPQMLKFLKAIGKQSMLGGEIEQYVKRGRLDHCERAGQDPSQIRIAVEGGRSSEQDSG